MAITETWLSEDRHSAEFFDPDLFDVYRCDRNNPEKKTGGGTLLAVKSTIRSTSIDVQDLNTMFLTIDTVGAEILFESGHLCIFVIYIPPLTKADVLSDYLDRLELFTCFNSKKCLLLGDFNSPIFYQLVHQRVITLILTLLMLLQRRLDLLNLIKFLIQMSDYWTWSSTVPLAL